MAFVYNAIDKDVGIRLRGQNPQPRHRRNHHHWLKECGKEKVKEQITKVAAIMKLCRDMSDYREKFATVFKKSDPLQMTLFN